MCSGKNRHKRTCHVQSATASVEETSAGEEDHSDSSTSSISNDEDDEEEKEMAAAPDTETHNLLFPNRYISHSDFRADNRPFQHYRRHLGLCGNGVKY